jgi:hypothetical protein
MERSAQRFVFPEVTEHTPIMVAQRPGEPGIPAFVTKVKSSTVSAVAIMTGPGGGLLRFETCYHRDDPRVIERPAIFDESHNGIFWLSELELERRNAVERMRSLDKEVTQKITAIEQRQKSELDAMNALLEEMVTRLSKVEGRNAQPKKV